MSLRSMECALGLAAVQPPYDSQVAAILSSVKGARKGVARID